MLTYRVIQLLDQALDQCRRLVLETGAVLVWEKTRADGHKEVVSELDEAIENLLVQAIRKEYSGAAFVGEETLADLTLLDKRLCFVIDPIDGTKEFLAGRDGFCISVALLQERRPVLGVLEFPSRRQRFWAQTGGGTSLNGRKIHIARSPGRQGLKVAVSPTQAANPRFKAVRRNLDGVTLEPAGALAAKLAGVACSDYDAAFFLAWEGSRTPVWDFAAAGLVVEEAGGLFTALDGSHLLETMPGLHCGGWLAASRRCHGKLLALLARLPEADNT